MAAQRTLLMVTESCWKNNQNSLLTAYFVCFALALYDDVSPRTPGRVNIGVCFRFSFANSIQFDNPYRPEFPLTTARNSNTFPSTLFRFPVLIINIITVHAALRVGSVVIFLSLTLPFLRCAPRESPYAQHAKNVNVSGVHDE